MLVVDLLCHRYITQSVNRYSHLQTAMASAPSNIKNTFTLLSSVNDLTEFRENNLDDYHLCNTSELLLTDCESSNSMPQGLPTSTMTQPPENSFEKDKLDALYTMLSNTKIPRGLIDSLEDKICTIENPAFFDINLLTQAQKSSLREPNFDKMTSPSFDLTNQNNFVDPKLQNSKEMESRREKDTNQPQPVSSTK